jgi:hypothetical protein
VRLKSAALAGRFEFWKSVWMSIGAAQLQYADFPFALPRPMVPTFKGGTEVVALGPETAAAVAGLATATRTTSAAVFLSGIVLMLRGLTKKDQINIWTSAPNRSELAWRNIVGWLDNSHMMVVDLHGDPCGAELVRRTHNAITQVLANQEVPLQAVWNGMGVSMDVSDVKISFGVRGVGGMRRSSTGVVMRSVPAPGGVTQAGMSFAVCPETSGLSMSLSHSAERVVSAAAAWMLERATACVHDVVTRPDVSVSRY